MKKLLFCLLFFVCLNIHHAHADEGKLFIEPAGTNTSGYFYIEGQPGESHTISLKISNPSHQLSGSGTLFISDAVTGKGGGMATLTPQSAARQRTSLWFTFKQKDIVLKPGEVKVLPLSFTIPKTALPGDHIANVELYKFVPAESRQNSPQANKAKIIVNNAYSQAYAVWVKIKGPEKHQLSLTKLTPTWNGADLFLDIYLANKGNVLEKSKGTVRIYKKHKLIMTKTASMGSIYPGDQSYFSLLIDDEKARQPGTYQADITWTYAGQTLHRTFTYSLKRTDANRAEHIIVKGNGDNTPEGLFITKADLIKYGAILAGSILLIVVVIIILVKRKKKRKQK
ncbi:hypothetical protein GCM10011391_02090 [Pullulanibacillus camelliae]|uniref:DUF3324 domain-containing protein n=1 Tax=Pullulanibacillus camelliae TaxID=1707096 RepID=A0A8J2VEJ9_9BACL|nr:DUF3324 domain-containing protein [Pullulanibacillus camelliae]GGE27312.1 hypothetical protein GCM10011391_02090 [Pullulanibacillus camelliae]